jgi:uncharacterized protein (TIGR03435 family)
MMREIVCASLMVFTSGGALGQASAVSTAFEVASVKTNQTSRGGGEGSERENIASSPGSLTMLNVSLRSCILWAYRVRTYQISGPASLSSDRYDIVAKTSSPAADDQLRLMLQTLLADRFKLALHREKKELPVYWLVAGKGGPKILAAAGEGNSTMRPAGGGLEFRNFSMPELADRLSARPFSVDRPVLDKTGLSGLFDFTIKLADNAAELKHTLEGMERGGSDFALFLEQLGLKLQAQKGPAEILVINRVEKAPVEN